MSLFYKLLLPLGVISLFISLVSMDRMKRPMKEMISKPNTTYRIDRDYDLQGGTIEIPENCKLIFGRRGRIYNGILVGNNTKIRFRKGCLGALLKGNWKTSQIYDEWFDASVLSDDEIINNINILQSDDITQTICLNKESYKCSVENSGILLRVSSNTTLKLRSTVELTPSSLQNYSVISIRNKHNIQVSGGVIMGDVMTHIVKDEKNPGEWGMGISIINSQNVVIEDMIIKHCWGDGIYLSGGVEKALGDYQNASKNITINNVICDANRRQGMSIIHVDGLKVSNSSFINTGQVKFTSPGAGIDMEPNVLNGRNMSVRNVIVDNCSLTNNKGAAISNSTTFEMDGKVNFENIVFSNCFTDGLLKAQSTDVIFKKCRFKEIRFSSIYAPTHIKFEDCYIGGGYGIRLYTPSEPGVQSTDRLLAVEFNGCEINVSDEKLSTRALIITSKEFIQNLQYIKINNCNIKVPKSKPGNFNLTDYNFNNKLYITSTRIEMEGRKIDAQGMVLNNNEIICKSIEGLSQSSNIIKCVE